MVLLVFNQSKRAYVTQLLIHLHWLPVATRIKFKSLMLAHRETSGSALISLNSIKQAYAPSRPLCSSEEHCLMLPSLHTRQSQPRLFSFEIPQWWDELQNVIRAGATLYLCESLGISWRLISCEGTSSPNNSMTLTCLTSTFHAL